MDHVNLALDCKLLKATQYNGSMFIHKFEKQFSTKVAWVQPFIRDEIIDGVNIFWGGEKPTNLIGHAYASRNCPITQMPTDGKLHNVPCVQFSFSNDSTLLSEFVEWEVNVIANSIDSVFSTIIIWGNPRIQAATVI